MEEFKYFYHCPTCDHDCVTNFFEQPYEFASFTCCCENDILITKADHEKKHLTCSSLNYNGYVSA